MIQSHRGFQTCRQIRRGKTDGQNRVKKPRLEQAAGGCVGREIRTHSVKDVPFRLSLVFVSPLRIPKAMKFCTLRSPNAWHTQSHVSVPNVTTLSPPCHRSDYFQSHDTLGFQEAAKDDLKKWQCISNANDVNSKFFIHFLKSLLYCSVAICQ